MSAIIRWDDEEFRITDGKWSGPVAAITRMLQLYTDSDRLEAYGRYDPNPDANDAQRATDHFGLELLHYDENAPLPEGAIP